ncbi:MAG: domain family protein [Bacillus sp. (in: firmicutes)]|nr:domain family protein [Bacillus sp. (in: firmicutes)]
MYILEKKEFWRLIEKSREFDQAEWLSEELAQKGLVEVLDFEFNFQELMSASYQSRLWGAAFVLMGGCSDDAFDYFRGWLIGQGEEIYNKVMKDPEFLAEYINEENLDDEGFPQNEELLTVVLDAYTLIKKGDIEWDDEIHNELLEALDKKGLQPVPDIEFNWEEDDLENLFPVLWGRFGEEPLG